MTTGREPTGDATTGAILAPRGAGPPGSLARGERIGRYTVLGELGRGAMGIVYEAYDPELTRRVAIKVLDDSTDTVEQQSRRVLLEARAIAALAHPNVIAVYDAGLLGERAGVVMELVRGEDLATMLGRRRWTWGELREIFLQAGRGLAAAHAAGLVHRDFKPGNVLVGADGRVRVADFGLAVAQDALTRDPCATAPSFHGPAGTPAYLAPEIHDGGTCDHRSDQYSFCVALLEALCGQRPFVARTREGHAIATPCLPRRSAPASVVGAIRRGLAVDPARRHASMDALVARLASDRPPLLRRVTHGAVIAALVAVPLAVATSVISRSHTQSDPRNGCDVRSDYGSRSSDVAGRVNAHGIGASIWMLTRSRTPMSRSCVHLLHVLSITGTVFVAACDEDHPHRERVEAALDLVQAQRFDEALALVDAEVITEDHASAVPTPDELAASVEPEALSCYDTYLDCNSDCFNELFGPSHACMRTCYCIFTFCSGSSCLIEGV